MSDSTKPVLSVIVAIVSDTTQARAGVDHLAGCLEAFGNQVDAPPLELIVPYHDSVDGIEALKERFPDVVFVAAEGVVRHGRGREHHDVIRARGLAVARGELIALVEDHARPDPGWCASVVAAHRGDYAGVGGAIDNGIDRALNWAVYFCDFGKYQNPLPAGPSPFSSDANTSYKRRALEAVRPVWQESFREVVVNGKLMEMGEEVALDPAMVIYQHRSDLRLGSALSERYVWGRSYAATRNGLLSFPKRLVYAALSVVLPAVLVLRLALTALQRRRLFGKFLKALPLVALLQVSWSFGEGVGYLVGVRE